ncbi:MAG: hypothetical protein INR73_00935 [Williamsia sp.]|nr:hypothetical protein [Williamsia sp.]
MKKTFLAFLCAVLVGQVAMSQEFDDDKGKNRNSGLALSIGASATYYYGQSSRNFDKFEDDRVNWQLNGLLGITVARDKGGRRTMLTAFGNYGFNNKKTLSRLLADQRYTTLALNQSTSNNFYQLEAGVIIAEVLRISTGVGQQNFNEQLLASTDGIRFNAKFLKYYSSTVGLNFNLASVTWTINCNFAYGKDFNRTVLTPSTGLLLRF